VQKTAGLNSGEDAHGLERSTLNIKRSTSKFLDGCAGYAQRCPLYSGVGKIGRNAQCPCGSGKKYKECCLQKVDWESLSNAPRTVQARYLSARGKNCLFMAVLGAALQLDKIEQPANYVDFKRAFTPEAVRDIYAAIPEIWPNGEDYRRCMFAERDSVSALYSGTYTPEAILRAITRHSLYSERIFLVGPFAYAPLFREEFNPVMHPEQHRANAVRNTYLWWSLAPWIEAGIVCFVRTPGDFDSSIEREVIEIEREKMADNARLRAAIAEQTQKEMQTIGAFDRDFGEYFWLRHSNEKLLEMMKDYPGENPFSTDKEFLAYVERRRDEHPYYVASLPAQSNEFLLTTSGSSYEMAKRICALGDFHIITDYQSRWLELELDFEFVSGNLRNWSPFSKSFQSANVKVLDKVPLASALRLREERRLEALRLFLRKVWRSSREPEAFAEENAINLAAELEEKIGEAEGEYKKIDQELITWFGAAGAALFTSGVVGFVPAASASVVTAAAALVRSSWQRRSFNAQFPAGFFLGVKDR
jgi:SEC-C motif